MNPLIMFLRSFIYAMAGWRSAVRTQRNFRIHLLVTVMVVVAGYHFSISRTEWCFVLLCIGLVLSAELFNSSIETMIDLVHPERHPLAGRTKDMAAGAVLITAIMAVIIGLIIFLPYLLTT